MVGAFLTKPEQIPELPQDSRSRKEKKTKYDQSLFKALIKTFFFQIWTAGILKLLAGKFQIYIVPLFHLAHPAKMKLLDTLNTTSPLLNKVLLEWLTDSYTYFRLTKAEQAVAAAQGLSKPKGLGYGIGLAFALFIMQGAEC